MSNERECDATVIIGTLVVFSLPLTLLIPNFSVWNIVPKIQVSRFHVLSNCLTWAQLNSVIVALLAVFLCLYLEIRKRKLVLFLILYSHKYIYPILKWSTNY